MSKTEPKTTISVSDNFRMVIVEKYTDKWKQDFLDIKSELEQALGDTALRIEHVGSTSVEGLSAKPVIDIDVVIEDETHLNEAISRLASIGYRHEGDLGIRGREAFKYDGKTHLLKHHLYVCAKDSPELKRHLTLRDYLRSKEEAVKEYGRIKEEGARLYPNDMDKYIEHKSGWIENVYRHLGL